MKLSELTGHARDNALATLSEWNTDYEWWDSVYENVREKHRAMGINVADIAFSGFWSQGDGAAFTGSVNLSDWIEHWLSTHPADHALTPHVMVLQELEREGWIDNTLTISVNSRRSFTMSVPSLYVYGGDLIDVTMRDGPYKGAVVEDLAAALDLDAIDTEILESVQEIADSIFYQLRDEYEHLTSEDALLELAEINDYNFNDTGRVIFN